VNDWYIEKRKILIQTLDTNEVYWGLSKPFIEKSILVCRSLSFLGAIFCSADVILNFNSEERHTDKIKTFLWMGQFMFFIFHSVSGYNLSLDTNFQNHLWRMIDHLSPAIWFILRKLESKVCQSFVTSKTYYHTVRTMIYMSNFV
jgi:hypothetical protein